MDGLTRRLVDLEAACESYLNQSAHDICRIEAVYLSGLPEAHLQRMYDQGIQDRAHGMEWLARRGDVFPLTALSRADRYLSSAAAAFKTVADITIGKEAWLSELALGG